MNDPDWVADEGKVHVGWWTDPITGRREATFAADYQTRIDKQIADSKAPVPEWLREQWRLAITGHTRNQEEEKDG